MSIQKIESEEVRGIAETLQDRPEIIQLYNIVKDDPKLIDAAIELIDIMRKKEAIPMERLNFIPEKFRELFKAKAVNGMISYNDFEFSAQKMINHPMKARA